MTSSDQEMTLDEIKNAVRNILARVSKDPDETSARLANEAADVAFKLIEWAEGDVELARAIFDQAFEQAERINHNQMLDRDAD
jgi:hypothetical protein